MSTRSQRILLSATAFLCSLALVASVAEAKKPEKGEASLVRTADAPDDDARGDVKVRSHKNDERFRVKAKSIDSDGDPTVELWIADDMDVLTLIGELRRSDGDDDGDDEGTYHYRDRIKKGSGELPLGADGIDELAGRALEIRSDGTAVLDGTIPDTSASPRDKGRARSELDPTADAPDDARARFEMRSRPAKGDERFEVKIDDFPLADAGDGEELRLYIEDPDNAGTLEDVGGFVERSGEDEHRFRRRTRHGDRLPFGVDGVGDLVGLEIEVRDSDGSTTFFEGVIPELD